MPTQKKIFTVANLAQKLKDAKAVVLADYRGLSVEQMTDLREKVKEAGGELEVAKNRLLKIAAKQAKAELDDQALNGPTAVLWAFEDEIQPIKTMDQFAKDSGLPTPKSGLFNGQLISIERIKELASLPSKEALQAKVVGALSSPVYGLVNNLGGNIRKLVFILNAKRESEKTKGGEN